jgi:hypothetical protein
MNNLQNFLHKFLDKVKSPAVFKKQIIEIIKTTTSIQLDEKELSFKDHLMIVTSSPSIRNELFMRKRAILKELEAALGDKAPKDIR